MTLFTTVLIAFDYNIWLSTNQFDGLSMLAYNSPSAFGVGTNQFQDLVVEYISKGCPESMTEAVLNEFGTYRTASGQIMPWLWKRNVLGGLIFCGYDYDVATK